MNPSKLMDVFDLDGKLLNHYTAFARSFTRIRSIEVTLPKILSIWCGGAELVTISICQPKVK